MDTRACQPPHDGYPFCNTKLSITDRVNNLISLLQDSEIPPQLTARHGGGGSPNPPSNVSRIGLPEYDWGMNAIHGVQSSCVQVAGGAIKCPTSFPNPVNYGMSFNNSLFYDLGAIIATESRALWLAGATEENPWSGLPHIGLDAWSPNINIARDPRWGRSQEVPGEDPLLNGAFGSYYTQGLQQGEDPRYIKVAVTLKHWDAYSLEDSDGFTRHTFNAVVSPFAFQDTYWPAFRRSVVEGNAKGVMCSYNEVNGVPSCASSFLANVLRNVWGFDGYITGDSGAVEDIWQTHKYVQTEQEAACVAIRNGTTDVDSGACYHDALLSAVQAGLCSRADVDAALFHTFKLRMEMGLFDPVDNQPYWHVTPDQINTPAAQANQLLATQSGMVLLKNDGTLPLSVGKRIAVIGPHANATAALVGNYLGQLCDQDSAPWPSTQCVQSPFQAFSAANSGGTVAMAQGCPLVQNDTSGFAAAVQLAKASDVVVLMLGIDDSVEAESHDRTSIDLPYIQHQLVAAVAAVGKPTVIVLLNGGPVDITAERDSSAVGAILGAGYPGIIGAQVIAATLFGQNDHLGGKLPYTIYPANYVNQILMTEMELDVGVGRGYRYYTGESVYPFGYGLSYTSFSIAPAAQFSRDEVLPAEASASRALSYSVNVTNTGAVTGDEVVFLYMAPQSRMPSQENAEVGNLPLIKELLDYQRVHLAPGESTVVTFPVSSESFRMVGRARHVEGAILSVPGEFDLIMTNGVDQEIRARVTIKGDKPVVVEPFPRM